MVVMMYYNLFLTFYNYLSVMSAVYLCNCGHHIDKQFCSQPACRFSCCASASTVWNSLPSFVRTADSFTSFRPQLKTYMLARHL